MKSEESGYFLTWKGNQTGPFSLEQIRAQLASGEISRMHRIGVNGGWQLLDEFLTQADANATARHASEWQDREAKLHREFDARLDAERRRQLPARDDADEEAPRSAFSHLLPKPPPPPVFVAAAPAPGRDEEANGPTRTSGLAIASLVMALGNFIPYVNFFTWILALVFGHTALAQMKRDDRLDGRGMAIAGLVITYFLLVMGLTFAVLVFLNYQKLPNLFSR